MIFTTSTGRIIWLGSPEEPPTDPPPAGSLVPAPRPPAPPSLPARRAVPFAYSSEYVTEDIELPEMFTG